MRPTCYRAPREVGQVRLPDRVRRLFVRQRQGLSPGHSQVVHVDIFEGQGRRRVESAGAVRALVAAANECLGNKMRWGAGMNEGGTRRSMGKGGGGVGG